MNRILATLVLFATLVALSHAFQPPERAAAHPLGNFTVNRYTRIELSAELIRLRYVIDMAEIPAFSEIKAIDRSGDGAVSEDETSAYLARRVPELLAALDLRLDGKRIELRVDARELTTPAGQGGLDTLRIVLGLTAVPPEGWQAGVDATFEDRNYADRLGWKEIVVRDGSGAVLQRSDTAAIDVSNELTVYPENQLTSPLNVQRATFRFAAGEGATLPAPNGTNTSGGSSKAGAAFTRLIEERDLTPAFVAVSLLAAMLWGAAHALGPGHGKTIVAAYLVGSRGTARHALLLGLTVTATHTSSVIALGLVTLYASRYVATEDLYVWLSVASGVLVIAMGAMLFVSRGRRWLTNRASTDVSAIDHTHAHNDGHAHSHEGHAHAQRDEHAHSHLPTAPGLRGLIALGISGGILPCPTALVVMLGAIALDRVGYGLVLVLAFSIGLAGVLTSIGLLLVYARGIVSGSGRAGSLLRSPLSMRWLQATPIVSALVILAVGVLLTGRALSVV